MTNFIDLANPNIFASFGGEEYWDILEVPAGQVVLQEGEMSKDFYYIAAGSLEVSKALSDGSKKHLADLFNGDFFGEGSLLSEESRGASVVTAGACTLYKLSKADFDRLVMDNSVAAVGIVLGIVKVLNSRMKLMNGRLVALTNVAKYVRQFSGDVSQIMVTIFMELEKRLGAKALALYGMDGLLHFQSASLDTDTQEAYGRAIPDYANRLSAEGAPAFFVDVDQAFVSVRNLQGQLVGVLAAQVNEDTADQDVRVIVTVAEQIGHLF